MAANLQLVISAVDHASGVIKDVSKASGGLSKAHVLMGAAAAGAGAAIGGMAVFLVKSVQEAAEAQANIAQLEAVLASTGSAAGLSKEQILDMATALSTVTTFSDDAILSAQNLLLTFTNIKGPQVEGATQAILDMATAMDQDLNTTAIQVGKALQDPINGVTTLRRVGVQLSDQQEQQIKDFLAVGDAASAQKVILGELTKEFGGSAAKAADTFGGRMKQLQNAFGEIQEAIGTALLPILTDLAKELAAFLTEHRDDIERLARQFVEWARSEAWPALKDIFNTFTNDILPVLIEAFQQLQQTIGDIMPVVEPVFNFFKENEVALLALIVALGVLAIAFGGPVTAIIGVIAVGAILLAHWDDIKKKIQEVIAWIQEHQAVMTALGIGMALLLGPIGVLIGGIILLIAHWDKVTWFINNIVVPAFNAVMWVIKNVAIPAINDIAWVVNNVLIPVFNAGKDVVNNVIIPALSGLKDFINNNVVPAFSTAASIFNSTVVPAINGIKDAFNDAKSAAKFLIDKVNDLIDVLGKIPTPGDIIPGGLPDVNPFRASGGPVAAGGSYIVGEKGPEWFVPKSSGTIVPNMGGGDTYITITVPVTYAPMYSDAGPAESERFGGAVAKVVRREMNHS